MLDRMLPVMAIVERATGVPVLATQPLGPRQWLQPEARPPRRHGQKRLRLSIAMPIFLTYTLHIIHVCTSPYLFLISPHHNDLLLDNQNLPKTRVHDGRSN